MKRFAVISAFAALLVGIVAMPSGAASFVDYTPCPASGPLLVCPTGYVGQPYSVQLLAHTGCDVYWWEMPNGSPPAGTTLSLSGLVSGIPTTVGEWVPWVHVHDLTANMGGPSWCGGDSQSQRQFVFRVVPGLSIRDEPFPAATIGQAYSKTVTVDAITSLNPRTGSPTTANWSIASGSLPAGITFDKGVVSGTPTAEGDYTFVVRATGGGGATDTETFRIHVRQPVSLASPFIRGASAPKAEVGIAFTAAQNATGGTGSYTWTVAGGSLPAGLVLDAATGTLSGTPTTPGRYSFILRATDSEGRIANVNATLNVAAKLAIATRTLKAAEVGVAYRVKLAKLGGVAPIVWTIRGKLPKGLKFNAKQGLFTGTPTQAGTFRLSLQAVDALGARATKTLKLVVGA